MEKEIIYLEKWAYNGDTVKLEYSDKAVVYVSKTDFDRAFGAIIGAEKHEIIRDFAVSVENFKDKLVYRCEAELNEMKEMLVEEGNVGEVISKAHEIATKEDICCFLKDADIDPAAAEYLNSIPDVLDSIYAEYLRNDSFLHVDTEAVTEICNSFKPTQRRVNKER